MNFLEIRRRVENEMAHYPDNAGHRQDLREVVQGVYEAFCAERDWPWLRQRIPFYQLPDVTIPNADVTLPVGTDWGDRSFVLPTMFDLGIAPENLQGSPYLFERMLVGCEFGLADPTLESPGGNFELGPFTIEAVVDLGVGPGPTIQLDPRCTVTALSSSSGDYVLRQPRHLLPADVRQVVAVIDPSGEPMRAILPNEARSIEAQDHRDRPGSPGWFLEDMGADLRFPMHIDMFLDLPQRSPWIYQRETWPMREVISCTTASGGAGTFRDSTRIRVFCCWFWAGRFGPPSNVVEFTLGVASNDWEVTVTDYPILPTGGAQIEYGRRVAIFLAEGEGAFFLRAFVTSPAAASTTITIRNIEDNTTGLRFPRWDEVYPNRPYQYLRMFPRPTGVVKYDLEYIKRPRTLIEDTDSPEFAEDHEVLVWMSVASLLASPRYNGNPTAALVMADRYRRSIMAQTMPQTRYDVRRGQITGVPWSWRHFFDRPINYIP